MGWPRDARPLGGPPAMPQRNDFLAGTLDIVMLGGLLVHPLYPLMDAHAQWLGIPAFY